MKSRVPTPKDAAFFLVNPGKPASASAAGRAWLSKDAGTPTGDGRTRRCRLSGMSTKDVGAFSYSDIRIHPPEQSKSPSEGALWIAAACAGYAIEVIATLKKGWRCPYFLKYFDFCL